MVFFGGMFDPPHRAHVVLPPRARDVLFGEGGWLVYVPAAVSPHRPDGPAAPAGDRVHMLRLATRALERSVVWTDEVDRAGAAEPSYTIDTLERARRVLPPGLPMRLLIGSDQAAGFHRWRDPRRIIDLAPPAVMPRAPAESADDVAEMLARSGAWTREDLERWRAWVLPEPHIDASSSRVREMVRAGRWDELRREGLLDEAVLGRIRARGLYGPPRASAPGAT